MERNSAVLFRPFSLNTWLKLALIAALAGQLTSGCNLNGSGNNSDKEKDKSKVEAKATSAATTSASATSATADLKKSDSTESINKVKEWLKANTSLAIGIGVSLALLFLLITLFFSWLSARCSFVWFHFFAAKESKVRFAYAYHKKSAGSYFRWSWTIGISYILILALIVGAGFMQAQLQGLFGGKVIESNPKLLLQFIPHVIFIIAGSLFYVLILTWMQQMVLTVMALDQLPFREALKKSFKIFSAKKSDIFMFFVWKILMSLVIGVLALIVVVLVAIVFLIAGLIIFGLGYWVSLVIFKSMPAMILYAVIFGVPFVVLFIVAIVCAQVSFAGFVRCFSIEYICGAEGGYSEEDLLRYKEKLQTFSQTSDDAQKAPMAPVFLAIMLLVIFMGGLLAAIAVPNFIQARNKTIQERLTQPKKAP